MESRWRVNLLCLVGALVGVMSIFLIWVKIRVFFVSGELNLIDLLNLAADNTGMEAGQVGIGCILVIVGSLLMFLSPAGGVLELLGVLLFLEWFLSGSGGEFPSSAGAYAALASGIIAIAAMTIPIGLGYGLAPIGLKGRLLTFSKNPANRAREATGTSRPAWTDVYCRYCGRPMANEAMVCPSCGRSVDRPPNTP